MAKKVAESQGEEGHPPVEGLNLESLSELLKTFGEVAPQVQVLLQTLSEAWKKRRPTMAATGQKTPNAHACACCDEALKAAMDTVAHLLDCKNCCTE